jgi:hypothetical protein
MVWQAVGDKIFRHLYKEYLIFLRTRDESLVQVAGTNIYVYLNDKLAGGLKKAFYDGKAALQAEADEVKAEDKKKNVPSHKFNLKNEKDDYTKNMSKEYAETVNRNRLFYCAHMNRKNAFF